MELLGRLKPYSGKAQVLVHNQSVGDIISGILKTHDLYISEYDKIYKQFDAPTVKGICKNLYNFLKHNTHYVIESDNKQTLRSPAAILKLGSNPKIGLDCKSFALFCCGVLDAFRRHGRDIDFCYRFASYKPFDKIPHHVFCVVNPGKENEIWVDNVIPKFDLKKKYFYKVDKIVPKMLYSVSGVGASKKPVKKTAKAAAKPAKQAARKIAKAKVKEKLKKVGRVVLKVNPATATARNAYLAITKLNFLNLAGKMAKYIQNNEAKLKSFWTSIGGDYTALKKSIEVGYKKKAIGNMYIAGPEVAAAPAIPIIIKVVNLLKSAGIDVQDIAKFAQDKLAKVAQDKVDEVVEKAAEKIEAATSTGEKPTAQQQEAAVEKATAEVSKEAATAAADSEAKEVETMMPSNIPWLPILGIGAAIYVLPKLAKSFKH